MKGWKNTLILVLVCATLGIYVSKFERGKVPDEGKIAVRFDSKGLATMEFKGDAQDKPITIRPEGKKWRIISPIETRGDQLAIDAIVDSLKELVSTHSLGKQKNLETYGLKSPAGTVTVALKKGKRIRLLFGKKTVDSMSVYAMLEGDPRIMVVPTATYDNFNKSLDDLRDKVVLSSNKDDVSKFSVSLKSGNMELEKRGADWRMTKPVEAPVEKTEADTLLGKVAPLRAAKFVDDRPADIKKYSLDKPWIQVDMWTANSKRPTTLFIGKKSQTDIGKVFAMTSTEKPVFLLPDTILTDLKKSPRDLRRKSVVSIVKDDATRVSLKNKQGAFGIEKSGDAWKLFQPSKAKADGGAVDTLLYAVQDLRADEFIDNPQPDEVYGLNAPQAEVAVTTKAATTKLLLGKRTADNLNVFAKVDGESTVYRVSTSIVESLNKGLNELRDKTVVKFDRRDLKRFSVKRDGNNLTIEHTGKDKWTITDPEKCDADSGKLSTTLYTLENISADLIVCELPADPVKVARTLAFYGLDRPRIEVSIELRKGEPIVILVGNRTQSGDKVFFMRKGDKTVYAKSDYLVTDLEKEVKDLKK